MKIESMKYFLDVADTGSIRMTAQNLFISQQGLSDIIKKMEDELGTVLLKRTKKGVNLTSSGKEVYEYCKRIVAEYESLQRTLWINRKNNMSREKKSVICLLLNPLAMTALVPDLLEDIDKQNSNIQLICRDIATLEQMKDEVKNGRADFCIFLVMQNDLETIIKKDEKDLDYLPLFSDELVACVGKDSEIASRDSITLDEFNAIEKVLSDSSYTPGYTDSDEIFVEYISNNAEFQLKLIQTRKVAAVTNRLFFNRTFPLDLVKPVPIRPALRLRYYLMYSPYLELDYGKMQFLQVLAELVKRNYGQQVDFHPLIKMVPEK